MDDKNLPIMPYILLLGHLLKDLAHKKGPTRDNDRRRSLQARRWWWRQRMWAFNDLVRLVSIWLTEAENGSSFSFHPDVLADAALVHQFERPTVGRRPSFDQSHPFGTAIFETLNVAFAVFFFLLILFRSFDWSLIARLAKFSEMWEDEIEKPPFAQSNNFNCQLKGILIEECVLLL